MDNDKIRQLWLEDELEEIPIPESILPKTLQGKKVHLVIRALDANTAGDILDHCTDKAGKTSQKKLMAMMLVNSVRNVDMPDKPLVWNTTFVQLLLQKNVAPMAAIAQKAIALSGMNVQLEAEKKDFDPMIVDGFVTASQEI